jgi:predicted transcriptional regulator
VNATKEQKSVVLLVVKAVLETLAEVPEGAPSGTVYMALMSSLGLSHAAYQGLLGNLVGSGAITNSGHLLRITAEGKQMIEAMRKAGV